jgi:hypothetical protein
MCENAKMILVKAVSGMGGEWREEFKYDVYKML